MGSGLGIATALALIAATLNLGTAVVQMVFARAPGWQGLRVFAVIALSAGVYSALDLVFCTTGLPAVAYIAAARATYLMATVHVIAWIVYGRGEEAQPFGALPRREKVIVALLGAAGFVFAATGVHLTGAVDTVRVDWASTVYSYPVASPVGAVYGLVLLATLVVAVGRHAFVDMHTRGATALQLAGLGAFVLCTIDELLVANRTITFLALADVGFIAIIAPTSVLLARRFVADAQRLAELTKDLEARVAERTRERDRAQVALHESERLAALGRLAAGIGHEINNPLTYVLLGLERLSGHLQATGAPAEVIDALDEAREGGQRIQKTVDGLRTYSRPAQAPRLVMLGDVATDALHLAGPRIRHSAKVELAVDAAPPVLGEASRLVQGLVNLLVNAAQAVGDNGSVVVRVGSTSAGEGCIEVSDSGPGVDPAHLRRMGEPYFTTRAKEGGLGLGLFTTRGIAEAHGGRLELESESGRGLRARLVLPAAPGVRPEAPAGGVGPAPVPPELLGPRPTPPAPLRAPGAGRSVGRVLIIEDEPLVARVLARALARSWLVTIANSADQALRLLEVEPPFDAVLCDLMMPRRTGMDLAHELASTRPEVRARMVFLTGGAATPEAQGFLERPDVRSLQKPVDMGELEAVLLDVTNAGSRGSSRSV
jgi:signal transduction histidine kinase/CheY-like chemotaxis protein